MTGLLERMGTRLSPEVQSAVQAECSSPQTVAVMAGFVRVGGAIVVKLPVSCLPSNQILYLAYYSRLIKVKDGVEYERGVIEHLIWLVCGCTVTYP